MPGDSVDHLFLSHGRRRSADLGGLCLATGNPGQGQGWVGYEDDDVLQTRFAELLSDMYTQTLHAVNEHSSEYAPTEMPTETRSRLIKSLDSWNFEPHKLPEEEILSCTLVLFEALYRIEGMEETVGISLKQISSFVFHLRQIYRWENSYHNFEHALDVLQASQCFLRSAGMVPPLSILLEGDDRMWRPDKEYDSGPIITSLGPLELFVVYIAAIGHDVGHPGFTNLFMKNAQTPLSVVFDDKSALEQMHCQLLLRVMRHHGMGGLLDKFYVRKLLWETVVATDMSVHYDFMARLESIIAGIQTPRCFRQIVASQAILKCADISNPSRPYPVSQHWAAALIEEWKSQANLEKHFSLPASIKPSNGPLDEAGSQVFFINAFAKPLLDLTVQAIPEMEVYAKQCALNLSIWKTRCDELKLEGQNVVTKPGPDPYPPTSPRLPEDFMTAFPLTLPPGQLSPRKEPTSIWTTFYPRLVSSGSSCTSSESDKRLHHDDPLPLSGPSSPSESVGSFLPSPHSDSSASNPRPPSSCGSSTNSSGPIHIINESNAVIRAASKAGKRKKKICENRNSWCASSLVTR